MSTGAQEDLLLTDLAMAKYDIEHSVTADEAYRYYRLARIRFYCAQDLAHVTHVSKRYWTEVTDALFAGLDSGRLVA